MSSLKASTSKKSKTPCHFFLIGKCIKGDTCQFSHDKKQKTESIPIPTTLTTKTTTVLASSQIENIDDSINLQLGGLKLEEEAPTSTNHFKYNQAVVTDLKTSSLPTEIVSPRTGISISPPIKTRNELCVFAMTGKCKYGPLCRSIHGIQCPRCLKFCLHPDNVDQNEEHIRECLENPRATDLETEDERRLECGICYEPVLSKPDPRFGLLNCDHAFCIQCIRTWRSKYSMDATNLRSCPLCRTNTYFVVPSSVWIYDPEEKAALIETYKKKLGEIPCKHYASGLTACPFGTSCFYSHAKEDGTVDRPSLRTVVNQNEKVNVYRENRLSDFIVFKEKPLRNKKQ